MKNIVEWRKYGMKIFFDCPYCGEKLIRNSSSIPILKDKAIRILMEDVKDHIFSRHNNEIKEEGEKI